MLLGRDVELARLRAVYREAAAGRGSVLVVTGEPGIGKSALLDAVAAEPDARVLRATGVEAEAAIAFATLQALLWPLRDELGELEAGQARLLRGVLELEPSSGATTFVVGAAALALLSVASRERPLIAVVDDVHWADVSSQEVLCFVGRRLEHERIALVGGARDDEPCLLAEERAFTRLELAGLEIGAARALLERSSQAALAPAVAERLLDLCAGNPLGLLELPLSLTEAQRSGSEPLPASLAAGPAVRRAFAARAEQLSPATRSALLLLAAAGEPEPALPAMDDAERAALSEAEAVGLISRGERIGFRHPLVRAAVYAVASADERRRAHRRLAAATEGPRRAWHLADAAEGPDEEAAEALERAAEQARRSGGVAAEAQALERAATLTLDRDRVAARLVAAARAWRQAGRLEHCRTLLERALPLAGGARTRAEIQLERGRLLMGDLDHARAHELLLAEAELVASTEPKLASTLLHYAALAADLTLEVPLGLELSERALALAGADGDVAELEAVNGLLEARMTSGEAPDRYDVELFERALALVRKLEPAVSVELACWLAFCFVLFERDDEARRVSDGALARARAAGDVFGLCYALYGRAAIEQAAGRTDAMHAWAMEAVPLAEQIGEPWRLSEARLFVARLESERGNPTACSAALAAAGEPVSRESSPLIRGQCLGRALLACGRANDAIPQLESALHAVERGGLLAWHRLVPLDLAEAYAAAGRSRDAAAVLRRVEPGIEAGPLVRPRARLARAQALLVSESRIDAAFGAALALLDQAPSPHERARTELGWGERLHAAGRAADSVVHLERALAHFEALGATGWAERARRALAAASGVERPAPERRSDELTTQELRVARHAAAGLRNREIAAAMYLSPRTVESHLQSAYRKLDVGNRTQLAAVLAAEGVRPLTPEGGDRRGAGQG